MTGGGSGESLLGCVCGNNSSPEEARGGKAWETGKVRGSGANMSTLGKALAKSTGIQCHHVLIWQIFHPEGNEAQWISSKQGCIKENPSSSTVCLPSWKHLQTARPLDQRRSSSIKAFGHSDLNPDKPYFFLQICFGSKLVQMIGHQACSYQVAFFFFLVTNCFGTFLNNGFQNDKTHRDLWHLLMSQGGPLKATVLPSAEVCSILLTPAEMWVMLLILPPTLTAFLSAFLSPCHIILYIFDTLVFSTFRSTHRKDQWAPKSAQGKGQEPVPGCKAGTYPPFISCRWVMMSAHPM